MALTNPEELPSAATELCEALQVKQERRGAGLIAVTVTLASLE